MISSPIECDKLSRVAGVEQEPVTENDLKYEVNTDASIPKDPSGSHAGPVISGCIQLGSEKRRHNGRAIPPKKPMAVSNMLFSARSRSIYALYDDVIEPIRRKKHCYIYNAFQVCCVIRGRRFELFEDVCSDGMMAL